MQEEENNKDLLKLNNSQTRVVDSILNKLEQENENLKARIQTERFISVIIVVIMFDGIIFVKSETWASPVCFTILEVILLFILGTSKIMANNSFTILMDKLIDSFKK